MRLTLLLLVSMLATSGFTQVSDIAKRELGLCASTECSTTSALSELTLPDGRINNNAEAGFIPSASPFYQSTESGGSSLCDTGGTLTVSKYLRASVEEFASNCGWQLVWGARRGSKTLDWKISLPFTVSYNNFADALEKMLSPYKGILGADLYVDVNVLVIKVNEDR